MGGRASPAHRIRWPWHEHALRRELREELGLEDFAVGELIWEHEREFPWARRLLAQQSRANEPVSVLMFDLDHFKSINDRFGHPVGDETLRAFAAAVTDNLRASDVVARFGGEEFGAVLPGPLADAMIAAERVRTSFQQAAATVAGCPLTATVSVGAASAGLAATEPASNAKLASSPLTCGKTLDGVRWLRLAQ